MQQLAATTSASAALLDAISRDAIECSALAALAATRCVVDSMLAL